MKTGTCEGCGKPMPYRRKDGTGLLRRFCGKVCGYQGNKSSLGPMPRTKRQRPVVVAGDAWWVGLPREAFYTEVRERFPEVGAAEVNRSKEFVGGASGPGLRARAREAKREQMRRSA